MTEAQEILDKLTDMEREWITGWKGPGGAAFNAVAGDLYRKGLLRSSTDWNLNMLGLAVRALLEKQNGR